MAWEYRFGCKGRYYCRSVRGPDGKVKRLYFGSEQNPVAQAAAALDALRRAEREAERAARRAEEERHTEAEKPLQQFSELTDILMKAVLFDAGYYQHARSSWRRKRHGSQQTT